MNIENYIESQYRFLMGKRKSQKYNSTTKNGIAV